MSHSGFLIDIRDIANDLGATVHLDAGVEVPVLAVGEQSYPASRPAHVLGYLANTGSGIVLSGTVELEVGAVCSRCLVPFPLPVSGELEGFYVEHGREDELPEEQEIGFVEDGYVDIMPAIHTALALGMPFAPLHDEKCAGICPTCGADLNAGPCTCKPDVSDSPFAALKDLLPPE